MHEDGEKGEALSHLLVAMAEYRLAGSGKKKARSSPQVETI